MCFLVGVEDGWQVCCYTHNLYRDANKFPCTMVLKHVRKASWAYTLTIVIMLYVCQGDGYGRRGADTVLTSARDISDRWETIPGFNRDVSRSRVSDLLRADGTHRSRLSDLLRADGREYRRRELHP